MYQQRHLTTCRGASICSSMPGAFREGSRLQVHQEVEVCIPVHDDPKVCLVAAVRLYLDWTSDTSIFKHYPRLHRYSPEYDLKNAPPLLIMSVTNGIKFPIGPDRISKWMFSVMQKAGVPAKYTSGSARMASASRLLDNGQNPDYVIGLGRWTSNSIFNKHYNRSRLRNMGILGITV